MEKPERRTSESASALLLASIEYTVSVLGREEGYKVKYTPSPNRLFMRLESLDSIKHLFVCVYLDGWIYCPFA